MSKLKRAILVVLDGVGVGANPDAHAYGDDGASSLEHCAQAVGGLELPNLGRIWGTLLLYWVHRRLIKPWVPMAAWQRLQQAKIARLATGR